MFGTIRINKTHANLWLTFNGVIIETHNDLNREYKAIINEKGDQCAICDDSSVYLFFNSEVSEQFEVITREENNEA